MRTTMEERSSIGTLIKCVTNEYEKNFNKEATKLGLTASQCEVLYFLYESSEEYVNQKDIEIHLSLSNPTVTGLLKRLDEKGYVLVVPNSTDKRKKNVHLTEKFIEMERKIANSKKKMERELLRGMKKNEIDCFKRYLEKALHNIEG